VELVAQVEAHQDQRPRPLLPPCRRSPLEFPSHIFIVGLSTRVGEQPNAIQYVFLVVNLFLQLDFIIAIIHILTYQICIPGLVVRALRFTSERLPVLNQTVCSCQSGKGAPKLFKSSEPKPSLSQRHHCLRPRGFLQIDCANESSIQLFKTPDARKFEMRLQNGYSTSMIIL
jgi:hypothetical protein